MTIQSPVTGNNTAELVRKLQTSRIIAQYQQELGIDVWPYFKGLNEIAIYECRESKYRFYHPANILGDSAFYEALQNVQGGDYYPKSKWEYERALSFIKRGDNVLEVGCGIGYFLEQAVEKPANVTGLELNQSAVEISRGKGLNVHYEMLDDHVRENAGRYDVVCAFQVLEHIGDVKGFVTDCLSGLKKDGYLIFAVPNSNPYLFRHDLYHTLNLPPHHAGLWNDESMKHLEKFFPLILEKLDYEPLKEYKKWYRVQVAHYKEKKAVLAGMLRLVPRQVYKPICKIFRNRIQGTYFVAVFKKTS